jgi:GNAT superfamily N-acetyltransferase
VKRGGKSVQILPASAQDQKAIHAIYTQVRLAQFPWIDPLTILPEDFSRDSEGEEVHVAIENDTVVGFVSVWSPESFIHHLFVARDFQQRGVGTQLLHFACQHHPAPLRLKCIKQNEAAVHFYQQNRWTIVDEGVSEDGPYFLMEFSGSTPDSPW